MERDSIDSDIRRLRSKAAELRQSLIDHNRIDPYFLAADLAMIATLLADHLERTAWIANVEVTTS